MIYHILLHTTGTLWREGRGRCGKLYFLHIIVYYPQPSHILFGCILHVQDEEVEVLMGGEVEGGVKVRRRGVVFDYVMCVVMM